MKKSKKKPLMVINKKRKRLGTILSRSKTQVPEAPAEGRASSSIIIYRSELDYVSRCILDRKDIETGGQLFGYWTSAGIPVVVYAIGPGPKANHQRTFFNQDVDYLVTVGHRLKAECGLWHIGEWHSHHQLGLAKPSRHDVNTMVTTIREKGLGHFLLCIGNCDDRTSSLNGYLCDGISCARRPWDVIQTDSPVRRIVDESLKDILVHPKTASASYSDRSISSAPLSRPRYAPAYWLEEKANNAVFKAIVDYVKARNAGIDTKVQLNGRGEVQIATESGGYSETILFPSGFPSTPPVITRYLNGNLLGRSNGEWPDGGGEGLLKSFIDYYKNN